MAGKNKGIRIVGYNHLNLPEKVEDENDNSKFIEYIYSAKGQKHETSYKL